MRSFAVAVSVVACLVVSSLSGCTGRSNAPKAPEASGAAKEPQPTTPETAVEKKSVTPPPPSGPDPALLDPKLASAQAPDKFQAKFTTTKGDFAIQVTREWAPRGADRFFNLVKIGYFTDVAFFRVIDGFMAQFGISGKPEINAAWHEARIPDDPVKHPNSRGHVSFATSGRDSRTTQLFINFADNSQLDGMGFAAFGVVSQGMEVVDALFKGYGEGAPRGRGPSQGLIQEKGNEYLRSSFPNLDYIKSATIE